MVVAAWTVEGDRPRASDPRDPDAENLEEDVARAASKKLRANSGGSPKRRLLYTRGCSEVEYYALHGRMRAHGCWHFLASPLDCACLLQSSLRLPSFGLA